MANLFGGWIVKAGQTVKLVKIIKINNISKDSLFGLLTHQAYLTPRLL